MFFELHIQFPDDFLEQYASFKEKIIGKSRDMDVSINKVKEIKYDYDTAILSIRDVNIKLPLASNQSHLLDFIFKKPHGVWIEETDAVVYFNSDNKRSFYDAIRAINEEVKKETNIEILEYKASRVRIALENLE